MVREAGLSWTSLFLGCQQRKNAIATKRHRITAINIALKKSTIGIKVGYLYF